MGAFLPPALFGPNLSRGKCMASGSTSFLSCTFIGLSDKLSLQNLALLSLNVWSLIVEFWYISSQVSFPFFINPRAQFLARSSIFSKFTFSLVVHLLVLLQVVPSSIFICTSSLPKFIFDSYLNLAGLSLRFCFDMLFFLGYCSSHLRFNLNINPVPLLHSLCTVVTTYSFHHLYRLTNGVLFELLHLE